MQNLKAIPFTPRVSEFLDVVRVWAEQKPDISAVAVVGSQAHGTARPDSDIDLVILSDNSAPLRITDWLEELGPLTQVSTETWGVLTSHRVEYVNAGEVEAGVADTSWADIPVDPGTERSVKDGIVPIFDPRGLLRKLIEEVRQRTSQ